MRNPNVSPYPWKVEGQSDGGRYIKVVDTNGRTIARVPFSRESAPLSEITDANDAAMLSAAPELYDALNEAIEALGSNADRSMLSRLHAAIRKARGEG